MLQKLRTRLVSIIWRYYEANIKINVYISKNVINYAKSFDKIKNNHSKISSYTSYYRMLKALPLGLPVIIVYVCWLAPPLLLLYEFGKFVYPVGPLAI